MAATETSGKAIGQAMRRKEDPRLITGRATYVDDIRLPGMLHAAIVRSTEAHAKIKSIDAGDAEQRDDVVLVLTGEDLTDLVHAPLPMAWAPPGAEIRTPDHWPLARGKVCCVGDPVAVVVGEDRYAVKDAAEGVVVSYEPLPAVVDPEEALEGRPAVIHEAFGTNHCHDWVLEGGEVDKAFEKAEVTVSRRITNHRTAGTAIEPRGVVAQWNGVDLTLWTSTQIPHLVRSFLAGEVGLPEQKVRVIAPEVGGGFGSKLNMYGEETLMAVCAMQTGRPVKWIEERSENLMTTTHGRDQIDYVDIAATKDGVVTGLKIRVLADLGAYHQLLTPFIPSFTAFIATGPYTIPAVRTGITGVFTNKFPTDAVRGAGRPEATHLLEVMMDQLAAELDMDPVEIRRKNLVPPEQFPYTAAPGLTYDSGDYPAALDKLIEMVDYDAFRAEQAELREQGVHRGIGFSTYVEMCGLAPSRVVGPNGVGLGAGFWESAVVRVHPSGTATVFTGTSPHGQGHETGFAQIVADRLGMTPDDVEIIHGDTGTGPYGMGTYGSRSLAVGGEACARAAGKVAEKAKAIAAHLLEAAPADMEVADGRYQVRGSPEAGMTVAEVSAAAYIPQDLPEGMEPGLEETSFYDPENFVFPFGAHAAIVDVDAETGKIKLVRYCAVDDCGPAINPMLIEGQVHGGIVHGVAQALYEEIHYDGNGQLVTGTFVDYTLPTAAELPSFETDRTETPSPVNELGVKGVGEAGTIAASPTIVNAALDALRPLGVSYLDMPLSPMRVWEQIRAQQPGGAS